VISEPVPTGSNLLAVPYLIRRLDPLPQLGERFFLARYSVVGRPPQGAHPLDNRLDNGQRWAAQFGQEFRGATEPY
jgi:hypothetical protein